MEPNQETDKPTENPQDNLEQKTIISLETEPNAPIDSQRNSKTISSWVKAHKKISATIILVSVAVIAATLKVFIYNSRNNTESVSITKSSQAKRRPISSASANSSTNTPAKSLAPALKSIAINLPEVYKPASGYSLANETYSPPTNLVSYGNIPSRQARTASETLITSRVMAYSRQTGNYSGLIDSQIDLYDMSSQKNYVLVPGGSSTASVYNNSPILLANNKMLFVQTTGSASKETSQLMLMNLKTEAISKVSLPFTDLTTLDAAAVAPNGIYVAYPMNNSILVLNTNTDTTTSYPVAMTGSKYSGSTTYEQMAWSSDSSKIFYANQYFITHNTSNGSAAFQPNNIFVLDLATGKAEQITSYSSGKDTLQVFGSNLYFKQYSSIYSSVEAYIALNSSANAINTIPNSNNFVWPILPTSDLTEYAVVPSNNPVIDLYNFQGKLLQNVYTNMVSSGKLVSHYYNLNLIGWADTQTLLISASNANNADDIYSYNIQTHAVDLILKSI